MTLTNLCGKIGLVVGVANDHSIAWGCAQAFRQHGADLAITYLNSKAEPYVRPLAKQVDAGLCLPMDVTDDEAVDEAFAGIEARWGRLDFLLHSIAFCPKEDLHVPVIDASRQGFLTAIDISCHSFLRLIRRAAPLMKDGGTCMTITFFGAERVVDHYNIMGPVKAALEASVRYSAAHLGPRGIRVHALSPGPLKTRAASGIDHFDSLLEDIAARTPQHRLATIEDVGAFAAFLACDAARNITGGVHYVDAGYNIVA